MASREYEDNIRAEIEDRAKCCIHHRPLEMYGRGEGTGCARDVPIRAKALAANGGSAFGIALRLPCIVAPDTLFKCPWFEARGVDRAASEMSAMREAGMMVIKKMAKQLRERSGSV